jgi:hypothetical protein
LINSPPLAGSFSLTPSSGVSLTTQFTASFAAWYDTSYKMSQFTLDFRIEYDTPSGQTLLLLPPTTFQFNGSSVFTLDNFVFPVLSTTLDPSIKVRLIAQDPFGATVNVLSTVTLLIFYNFRLLSQDHL